MTLSVTIDPVATLLPQAFDEINITFTQPVSGVDLGDFQLTRDGAEISLSDVQLVSTSMLNTSFKLTGLAQLMQEDGEYTLELIPESSGIIAVLDDVLTLPQLLTVGASVSWILDMTAPVASIAPIGEVTEAVDSINIFFSEDVTGFEVEDLILTVGGQAVDLTGADLSGSGSSYTLSGLAALLDVAGEYVLSLKSDSSIADAAGNTIQAGVLQTWSVLESSGTDTDPIDEVEPIGVEDPIEEDLDDPISGGNPIDEEELDAPIGGGSPIEEEELDAPIGGGSPIAENPIDGGDGIVEPIDEDPIIGDPIGDEEPIAESPIGGGDGIVEPSDGVDPIGVEDPIDEEDPIIEDPIGGGNPIEEDLEAPIGGGSPIEENPISGGDTGIVEPIDEDPISGGDTGIIEPIEENPISGGDTGIVEPIDEDPTIDDPIGIADPIAESPIGGDTGIVEPISGEENPIGGDTGIVEPIAESPIGGGDTGIIEPIDEVEPISVEDPIGDGNPINDDGDLIDNPIGSNDPIGEGEDPIGGNDPIGGDDDTGGSTPISGGGTPMEDNTPLAPFDPLSGATTTAPTDAFGKGRFSKRIRGTNNDDRLNGTNKNDVIFGRNGNDRINGRNGNDHIDGGKGNDRINGGKGDDLLRGGAGDDILSGGAGDDVLIGGTGNDVLIGGAGKDRFVFNSLNEGMNTIVDFQVADDLLDLRGIFKAIGATPADLAQVVQLEQIGSTTQVSIDADGLGAGTTFKPIVQLNNVAVSALSSSNFVVG